MSDTDKAVNSLYTPVKASKGDASAASFLYDRLGQRKYLTVSERRAFLKASAQMSVKVRLFCAVLAYAGARISEVLALKPSSFDQAAGLVVIESLKKRRRGVFRAVPLPKSLIKEILSLCAANPSDERIWRWSRVTGWTWVKKVMVQAKITGPKASPKGLRHAFGVSSLQTVPLTVLKKWLGHSRLSTTEIYAGAVGDEEQRIAARFWKSFGVAATPKTSGDPLVDMLYCKRSKAITAMQTSMMKGLDTMLMVETERETDGRWIADIALLPGVMSYGVSREEAVAKAEALALRILADRVEHGEAVPELAMLFSAA